MHRLFAGPAILNVLAGASIVVITTASPAGAVVPAAVCGATSCTTTFAETGAVQTFNVPSFVNSVLVTASGGQGGNGTSGGTVMAAGGEGGSSTADVTVTPGEILSVVVGGGGGAGKFSTNIGGAAGFAGGGPGGGGGVSGGNHGAGGGGGSFVFDADDVLLVAAGGGGGAAAPTKAGGNGGGANSAATKGAGTGGQPGTTAANGAHAFSEGGIDGTSGSGSAMSPSSLPLGGTGGSGTDSGGGGGGGGYHAGGGGGATDMSGQSAGGGGGGAGYAIASATDVSGSAGAQSGDGVVTISYDKGTQVISFTTSPPAVPAVGVSYPVATTGGESGDDVVLSVDPSTTNAACSLTGSTVTFDHVGSCVIDADQAGDDNYLAATTAQQTIEVVRKPSHTSVSVHPTSIVVSVAAATVDADDPTGSVTVTVDGQQIGAPDLTGGVATLSHVVPAGATHQVSATYAGDAEFSGSSITVQRRDPRVTTTLSSAKPVSHSWYRRPVTVHFHCTRTSAPIVRCPGAVTVSNNGKGQSVRRTVTATDGGASKVTSGRFNIDRIKPSVTITGPKPGKTYAAKVPKAHCVGHDTLSGVLSCTLSSQVSGHHVTVTATVVDRAGNSAVRRLTYTL